MLDIITERKVISKYQELFIDQLMNVCTEKVFWNVGFQGGSIPTTVFYLSKALLILRKLRSIIYLEVK